MISSKLLILNILIFYNFEDADCMRSFEIRFFRSNCTIISKTHVAFLECPVIEMPRNRGNFMNGRVRFYKDIDQLKADFLLNVPGGNKMLNLKYRADGCNVATHDALNPFVKAIAKQLVQSGNFLNNCPLKANHNYTLDQFAINPDYFPGYIPEMNFTARLNLYMRKTHLFYASIDVGVTKRK